MHARIPLTAAVLGAGLFVAVPTQAYDAKVQAPAATCVAFAPATTAAELQFTASGIYNPGTAIEKVVCSIPRDQELEYAMEQMEVDVDYRVLGAAPGRLTCTLFVGSAHQQAEPVVSTTDVGDLVANGNRASAHMVAGAQAADGIVPVSMVCAISPKTWMAGITLEEYWKTDTDPI